MTNVTITKDGEVIREVEYDKLGAICGITAGSLYGIAMKRATSGVLSNTGSSILGAITGLAFGSGVYAMMYLYRVTKEDAHDTID